MILFEKISPSWVFKRSTVFWRLSSFSCSKKKKVELSFYELRVMQTSCRGWIMLMSNLTLPLRQLQDDDKNYSSDDSWSLQLSPGRNDSEKYFKTCLKIRKLQDFVMIANIDDEKLNCRLIFVAFWSFYSKLCSLQTRLYQVRVQIAKVSWKFQACALASFACTSCRWEISKPRYKWDRQSANSVVPSAQRGLLRGSGRFTFNWACCRTCLRKWLVGRAQQFVEYQLSFSKPNCQGRWLQRHHESPRTSSQIQDDRCTYRHAGRWREWPRLLLYKV
jgi:hypothetical protein